MLTGVARMLRISRIIRVNGTGELADEGVPPGLVRAGDQAARLMPGGRLAVARLRASLFVTRQAIRTNGGPGN